jgi:hypothetical protein
MLPLVVLKNIIPDFAPIFFYISVLISFNILIRLSIAGYEYTTDSSVVSSSCRKSWTFFNLIAKHLSIDQSLYKTDTLPILMHQMRISTTQVSSVMLRSKKLEIREKNVKTEKACGILFAFGHRHFALKYSLHFC